MTDELDIDELDEMEERPEVSAEDDAYHRRMVEAVLFASHSPLSQADICERLPYGAGVEGHLESLTLEYETRGVNLVCVASKYMFATATDLSFLLRKEVEEQRKLSRAAVETLSIVAYHQPATRAEIEEIRGVGLSRGTLDVLMEAHWIRPLGRRKTPGRPVTYGITDDFLVHFGLESIKDLPGLAELKAAGLLDTVDQALTKMDFETSVEENEENDGQIDLEDVIEAHKAQDNDDDDDTEDGEDENW